MIVSTMKTPDSGQTQVPAYWSKRLSELGKQPNERCFAEIHAHFAPQIRSFLQHHSRGLSAAIAEELCQEVMTKVWLKARMFDPTKAAASTWIFTLCRNVRIDFLRKYQRNDMLNDSYEVHDENNTLHTDDIWQTEDNQPFIDLHQQRTQQQIKQGLSELSQEQRTALNKAYIQGLSHTEIADELDLPLGTVKSRVRLGLKRLHNLMTEA